MLIDSHCHLHDCQFFTAEEAEEALNRAHYNDVQKIICIGTDPDDSLAARDFAESHEEIYWTYGVHPNDWESWHNQSIDKNSKRLVAIGEVGLDYHYGLDQRNQQIKLLNEMLQLALDNNLPVSFHIREAFDDFWGVIANFPTIRGVIHSFSDNKKHLRRILETTDFYVGVNGLATYSTLPTPPLNRILLETDAPFLTPAPYRNIKNDSSYIKTIATWLAQKLSTIDPSHPVAFEEVADITTKNANDLFHFS